MKEFYTNEESYTCSQTDFSIHKKTPVKSRHNTTGMQRKKRDMNKMEFKEVTPHANNQICK